MRALLIFLFSILSATTVAQKAHFTPSPNCVAAYKHMVSFRLADGRAALRAEIKKDPYNHLIILLQNYEDFIRLTFQDDPALYERRKKYREKRLDFLSRSNKNSPYYLLSKGIIYLQWSLLHIKYKENWKAANDFRKAHALFKENKKRYPTFVENDIFFGAQQSIIGTIPKDYQWISNLLGLRGNIKEGLALLQKGANANTKLFHDDAVVYYIFLNDMLLNDARKAFRLIKAYNLDTKNNYLHTFTASNLSLNNFRAAETINILENRTKTSAYMHPYVFDYALGSAYLHVQNYKKAIPYLKKYLAAKGYFYKKDAALKIAYAYYLMDNIALSNLYKRKIKSVGTRVTDMDKQAQKKAEQANFGDKNLLRARLLFDGGDFSASKKILKNTARKSSLTAVESLEWDYRLARVFDETHDVNSAISFYKKTLAKPNPTQEYYPARAALQLAFIYETKNQRALATKYFNKVLSLDGHQFKTSLDQKAKSGLLRIQGQ